MLNDIQWSAAPVPFGIETYEMHSENEGGTAAVQAWGAHPFHITRPRVEPYRRFAEATGEHPGAYRSSFLPVTRNPTQCRLVTVHSSLHLENVSMNGPTDSPIGFASGDFNEPVSLHLQTIRWAGLQLIPSKGEPARFVMEALKVPVTFDTAIRSVATMAVF